MISSTSSETISVLLLGSGCFDATVSLLVAASAWPFSSGLSLVLSSTAEAFWCVLSVS